MSFVCRTLFTFIIFFSVSTKYSISDVLTFYPRHSFHIEDTNSSSGNGVSTYRSFSTVDSKKTLTAPHSLDILSSMNHRRPVHIITKVGSIKNKVSIKHSTNNTNDRFNSVNTTFTSGTSFSTISSTAKNRTRSRYRSQSADDGHKSSSDSGHVVQTSTINRFKNDTGIQTSINRPEDAMSSTDHHSRINSSITERDIEDFINSGVHDSVNDTSKNSNNSSETVSSTNHISSHIESEIIDVINTRNVSDSSDVDVNVDRNVSVEALSSSADHHSVKNKTVISQNYNISDSSSLNNRRLNETIKSSLDTENGNVSFRKVVTGNIRNNRNNSENEKPSFSRPVVYNITENNVITNNVKNSTLLPSLTSPVEKWEIDSREHSIPSNIPNLSNSIMYHKDQLNFSSIVGNLFLTPTLLARRNFIINVTSEDSGVHHFVNKTHTSNITINTSSNIRNITQHGESSESRFRNSRTKNIPTHSLKQKTRQILSKTTKNGSNRKGLSKLYQNGVRINSRYLSRQGDMIMNDDPSVSYGTGSDDEDEKITLQNTKKILRQWLESSIIDLSEEGEEGFGHEDNGWGFEYGDQHNDQEWNEESLIAKLFDQDWFSDSDMSFSEDFSEEDTFFACVDNYIWEQFISIGLHDFRGCDFNIVPNFVNVRSRWGRSIFTIPGCKKGTRRVKKKCKKIFRNK